MRMPPAGVSPYPRRELPVALRPIVKAFAAMERGQFALAFQHLAEAAQKAETRRDHRSFDYIAGVRRAIQAKARAAR